MAEIALPRHQATFTQGPTSSMESSLGQGHSLADCGPVELTPNPNFVFPLRSADPFLSPSETTFASNGRRMSAQALPTTKRHSTAGLSQRRSASVLPDFTFNPSGTGSGATTLKTPPLSPTLPSPVTPTTPSRKIGHRRGGSEFIGGDGRYGGTGLMSTSPTKGDGILPPPDSAARPGPPAGRRGHAHRRSGAISCHDLQSILQPTDGNAQTRGGSAPVTPMDRDVKSTMSQQGRRTMSHSSLRVGPAEDSGLFRDESDSSPRRPVPRVRVGFSDRIEYIRPLSTISSETESSMSTIRGHSVSGSLSSIINIGAASPPSARMARPTLDTTLEQGNATPRPTTAGAVLDVKRTTEEFGGLLEKFKQPSSASSPNPGMSQGSPSTSRLLSRRKNFFWQASRSEPSLPAALDMVVSGPSLPSHPLEPLLPAPVTGPSPLGAESGGQPKLDRAPRKVRSWASPFMFRKPKAQADKPVPTVDRPVTPPPRSQTAPPAVPSSPSTGLDFTPNFDIDDTVTIVSAPPTDVVRPKLDTSVVSWGPPSRSSSEPETFSPVIDLDAALGPFRTPPLGSSPRGNSRGLSSARRARYSSGFGGSSFGTNARKHDRTKSAPELVPPEFDQFAPSSSSAMLDVFEEDEEEDETNVKSTKRESNLLGLGTIGDEEGSGVGTQDTHSDGSCDNRGLSWNANDGLGIRESEENSMKSVTSEDTVLAAPSEAVAEPSSALLQTKLPHSRGPSPVEIVEDFEEPRSETLTKDSDSTITPTLSVDNGKEPDSYVGFSIPLTKPPRMTPDTFAASSFSSPDLHRGQNSFDTPRLGTGSSSIADNHTVHSLVLGEPGPELRMSYDDVPSLTSSRSTMTSGRRHEYSLPSLSIHDDRSSSISSFIPVPIAETRRKRASIASLSKLVSGSFGEKSKLSIEQRAQADQPEAPKEVKAKKQNRFGRLMQFWKNKESKGSKTSSLT